MLVPAAGGRDVRMPALGQLPASLLDSPLVERRLQLEEQEGLFHVEDPSHDPSTLAARSRPGEVWRLRVAALRGSPAWAPRLARLVSVGIDRPSVRADETREDGPAHAR